MSGWAPYVAGAATFAAVTPIATTPIGAEADPASLAIAPAPPPPARTIALWPAPLRWPDKAASETLDYGLDAAALQADPTDALSGVVAAGALTIIGVTAIGGIIAVWLGGGVAGVDNTVDLRISTTSGRFVHRIIRLLTQ